MLPVIAIVGRPNVGKSTLFNRLTKSRDALVADFPGLTRDRQYGESGWTDFPSIIIDTGGLGEATENLTDLMAGQTLQAIEEADLILMMVDARSGILGLDQSIAANLRVHNKKILLVVNKIDGINVPLAMADFFQLGLGDPIPIAAAHKRGVHHLLEKAFETLSIDLADKKLAEPATKGIAMCVIGRPNVGKSTLINRLLGEERVVVFDAPGTTRDSIFIPMERQGKPYTLIDTAGVRRKGRVKDVVEKFSIIKTLQAIEASHVVVALIDGQEGITDQDCHLLGFVLDAGKGLIIAVNKWDGLTPEAREKVKANLERKLGFVSYAPRLTISALHGTGVGLIWASVQKVYDAATLKLSTPLLTRLLIEAVAQHEPPMFQGRRIKLRYAHPGGSNPPTIVIHGNQTERLSASYRRYLMHYFQKALKIVGSPIRILCVSTDNPFKNKPNKRKPLKKRGLRRIKQSSKKK